MLSLISYAEAERTTNPRVWSNVTRTVKNHFLAMGRMMVDTPLESWAAERWTDLALAVAWLLDHGIGNDVEQAALFALGGTLHAQGTDWESAFSKHFVGSTGGARHNVNVAQAIKSSGIWYRFTKNESLRSLSLERMAVCPPSRSGHGGGRGGGGGQVDAAAL